MNHVSCFTAVIATAIVASPLIAQSDKADKAEKAAPASAKLQSVGPIAFAEGHVLLVSDPKGAAIYAFDIQDLAGEGLASDVSIAKIDEKIAALLGTEARGVSIVDVAVHPATRQAYVSVMRGEDTPVLLAISADNKIAEVSLEGRKFVKAGLGNAPAAVPADAAGRGNRGGGRGFGGNRRRGGRRGRRSQRLESITDIAWIRDKVIVAGLSNEEFSSKLRVIDYPFKKTPAGASVEIFHGAHGRFETRSPIRTFIPHEIEGKPHIVAAYTCTPLVLFPLDELQVGKKIRGKTIAELGNRNQPLDMISYEKDGKEYLLMSNSSRGVMKVPTEGMESQEPITEKTGIAGHGYETIKSWDGVLQLDKLDAKHALVLARSADGEFTLKAVALP